MNKGDINLKQHQEALKERKSQVKDIKNIISTNVNLIKDTCRLTSGVQLELAKCQTKKVSSV